MTQPIISVIIPVGPRHSAHCRVAAASARMQSIGSEKIEVVLIPDGGADVPDMPGCTVIRGDGTRRGPAWARNRGIERANGYFILPLDADDYLQPRGAEHLLRAYSAGIHGYVYGDAFTVEMNGDYVMRGAPDYVQADMASYNIHVITALTPAKHWRAVGGYDERVDAWEDWSGHLRLAIAGVCGYRVSQPTLVYRVFEGDRMTRFNKDRSTMEPVWRLYRNAEGIIPMSGCCGGDATLAQIAGRAVEGAPIPPAVAIDGGRVRVKYIGDEKGPIPFDFGGGVLIRIGASPMHRYADVTPEQAQWLGARIPVEVVPVADPPALPPAPLPVVVRPDAPIQALRPARVAI